jgi:hypothetical protein
MPYSVVEDYWRFGGTYWFHFQGRRVLFNHKDGGSVILWNIHKFLPDYMAISEDINLHSYHYENHRS